jgi:hypothetical protein
MIDRLYRRIGGIDLSMYGLRDYWKHNILNQIRERKTETGWIMQAGFLALNSF